MRFAKAIWKLLVGIKDALVLIFMLLFFGILYAGLSLRPAPVTDGVLAFELDGAVVEQPSKPTFTELAGGGQAPTEYRLRDLVAALDAAKDDSRVKAVALDLERFTGGGQVAVTALAEAVRRVRESGKPVIAYAPAYGDDAYLLASAASEIWVDPLGAVAIAGPGGPNLYFKGLLDKLGITANVYRVGTYKAAVEPFTRSDMSPEARENAQALGDALLETWREAVLKNRPKAKVDPYIRNPVGALAAAGGNLSQAALGFGLVDKVATREAFEARLAELGGKAAGERGGFKRIKIPAYVADTATEDDAGSIGVVTVAGMIVDGEAPAGTAGGDSIAAIIDKAVRKGGLKALVVRVDSPGGSVLASERIRQAILNAKREKMPVVVSMGNVAASGGYWVSTPADFIYAEPATITGSIGVFGILPSFEGTLQKLGIGADGIQTTPLSGEPDLLRGPSPVADTILQAAIDSVYRRFLSIVAQSRHKQPAEIDRIGQGRVWDGGSARQLGLVDGFGGLGDAIDKAGTLARIDNPRDQVRFLERPVSFEERLLELLAEDRNRNDMPAQDAFAALAPDSQLVSALADLRSVLSGPRIQVRCLECPASAPARIRKEDLGFLAALREWLF
ncbi:MAG TPA: signal peptide peptidase SppA [Sphingomicrobium sp.]|nr:signal peptide peptidase SppA [Sphingomicrobium sp.]